MSRLELSEMGACLGALIFAIHPMHVESVAWITERKDVLYGLFYVWALIFYLSYLREGGRRAYGLSLLFGLLSILSKPMAVSLPWILFSFDWLARRRWSWLVILDKIPFAALIGGIGFVTFSILERKTVPWTLETPLIFLSSFAFYIKKFLWPLNMVPLYAPDVRVTVWNPTYIMAGAIFILFILFLCIFRKNRWFVWACLFYVGSAFFLWRYNFEDSHFVADRFMYLPSMGFCLWLGYVWDSTWPRLVGKRKWARGVLIGGLCVIILGLSVLTFRQCRVWRDDRTLWESSLAVEPYNILLQDMWRGLKTNRAFDVEFFKTFEQTPSDAASYLQRGKKLLDLGHAYEAYEDFTRAITLDPHLEEPYLLRGGMYLMKNDFPHALQDLDEALKINPQSSSALINKGLTLLGLGHMPEALTQFEMAIRVNPSDFMAYYNRGLFYQQINQQDVAVEDFTNAIQLNPDFTDAYYHRGQSRIVLKQYKDAIDDFLKVTALSPELTKAFNEIGTVYHLQGDYRRAMDYFSLAITKDPYFKEAFNNRGLMHAQLGHIEAAIQDFNSGRLR